jgi:hypothetical protein
MAADIFDSKVAMNSSNRLGFLDFTTSVTDRTAVGTFIPDFPCANVVPVFQIADGSVKATLEATTIFNSFAFDFVARKKIPYLHLSWYVLAELPFPRIKSIEKQLRNRLAVWAALVAWNHRCFAPQWLELCVRFLYLRSKSWFSLWAISDSETTRLRALMDVIAATAFGLSFKDLEYTLKQCDLPASDLHISKRPIWLDRQGFWRIDKDKDPELRHTVLTLVAFHDLEEKIRACGGDREKGIDAFLNQNDGEGWMLPETLRLADYGLGHDDRAKEHQPVASRLGPRFYDWQLAQSPEESWRECHLHARNLLGKASYLNLLAEILRDTALGGWREALAFAYELSTKDNLLIVFTTAIGQLPPDEWQDRLDKVQPILSERGFSLDAADMTQILVKALRRVPEEVRPEGLSVVRDMLGESGMVTALRQILGYELRKTNNHWHVLARDHLGDAGYRQILADLEAEDYGKIAEPVEPYGTSTGKMTQRRLFD